jgi:hypothetical protein
MRPVVTPHKRTALMNVVSIERSRSGDANSSWSCRKRAHADPGDAARWYRRLVARMWDCTSRRRPGRLPAAAAIRKLVIRVCGGGGQAKVIRGLMILSSLVVIMAKA